jgi:hypothetical protein
MRAMTTTKTSMEIPISSLCPLTLRMGCRRHRSSKKHRYFQKIVARFCNVSHVQWMDCDDLAGVGYFLPQNLYWIIDWQHPWVFEKEFPPMFIIALFLRVKPD